MDRKILAFAGVFSLLATTSGLAQQAPEAPPATSVPAATASQIECSGFITASRVPNDTYVFAGADNDFRQPYHQYVPRNFVYLRSRRNESFAVGAEYRLVRPATEPVVAGMFNSGLGSLYMFGRSDWYTGQLSSIRSLGVAYEDVGSIKVTTVTPQGAVAQITFGCGLVSLGDLAVPYQARQIPTYTPAAAMDRFKPAEGKMKGAITAADQNRGVLGNGSLVFINLGESDGAKAGQRYRIFHIDREIVEGWGRAPSDTPTETLGELIVLFTEEKSSAAVVVNCIREVSLGDGIALE